ncbi:MAG: DUF664 domain-containing protein [Methanobacteriota archaeon]|nr:MAG: DUF664 domain-containing protein [Euryarchaeota archaeon]
MARRELGLGRLVDDLPCGRQHRDPDLPHGVDLAPRSRSAPHLSTRLYHSHRPARGGDHLHRHPAHALSSVRLASPRGRRGRRVPGLGREAVRGGPLVSPAFPEGPSLATGIRPRGLRVPDGFLPPLRRGTVLRRGPDHHGPRGGRDPGRGDALGSPHLGRSPVGSPATRVRRGVRRLLDRPLRVPGIGREPRDGDRRRCLRVPPGASIPKGVSFRRATGRARRTSNALVLAAPAESFMISPVVWRDMTTTADLRSIYQYNWRVLRDYGEALAKLPRDELVKNREATHGSMKNIFHHILSVHDGWLNVTAQGTSADPAMREKDFDEVPSMDPLRAYLEKIIAKEASFLAGLKDKDLSRHVKPEWKERSHPLQDALMQVTFEQAHHIGELIALFWQIDVEPPEMTWIDVRLAMKGDPGPS